ncbi:RNA editing complex protein MP61 [Angomonas deanei]|uniref:RNase III domain-containing protein n=1 Tax=Angomonas deanei TaxID=59799 RepID=A0A7G2C3B9_9TRYP|nr:RNA editing complex protein MP61 [Angomonas deanei]CAD2214196.1 hypothetical protein, conserved [Angomonas deanei]|eukprot:EPY19749.1 RNA editing complex protein MP61 [Angomonas deanei]
MRRCKLCNETYIQWFSHEKHVPHAGRMGMAVELLRAHCGKPEDIVEMWWHRLDTSTQFNRIRSLSHRDSHVRKRRIQYLIQFLVDRGVIAETFSLNSSDAHSAGRSYEFERLEFIGDNVVKYVLNDRLSCCFPPSEGGIRGRLGYFQFVMDGNEGLARTYDYLEFQRFSKSDRVVSKFKSDVVETIFGELQFYLLSTVQAYSTEEYPLPFSHGSYTLRALAEHTMEELAHIFFIHHVEAVLGCVQRIVRENQLHFVNADPVSQDTVKEETKSPNKSALSSTRIPFSTTAASQITESTILTSVQRSIDFTGTPAPREEEGSKKKVSLSIREEHKGEPSDRLFRPVPSAVHVLDSKELFTVKELKTKGLVEELV